MLDSSPGIASRNDRSAHLLMSIADCGKALTIGRSKFYQLVAAGELEIVKIGSATRVVVSSVEAYVDRLRAQTKKAA
jgi:excisionase family DNA binding protein